MWNAPVADKEHAVNACRCALAVERALARFNQKQRLAGLPEFRTRFGIHTGTAVVGSVGAIDRLQYTAMGETINVASRLEGLNKSYGTLILASASVVQQCANRISFRALGAASAKGRHEMLSVFEVVDERGE
jgi:adenylate cyclase